jgi:ATP-dependent RNA helicase DeaD
VPENRQTVFFSATMPPAIMSLTKKFQKDPVLVKVTNKELTVSTIEQFSFEVREDARVEALIRLIKVNNLKMVMVFCNTKRAVDELVEQLQIKGISSEALHGDLRQTQRNNVLAKFKSGNVAVLVATDVAARGIDVNGVDAVFNYDIPLDEESYVHRIGRTGRAGRAGKSFTFVTGRKDLQRLKDIVRYTKVEITPGKIPSNAEMFEIQKQAFFDKIINSINNEEIEAYKSLADELLQSNISPKHLLAALIKQQFNGSLAPNDEEDDLNLNINSQSERKSRGERGNDRYDRGADRVGRMDRGRGNRGSERKSLSSGDRKERDFHNGGENVKLFINVGKNFRISPGDILGAIVGEAKVEGKEIGAIEIRDKYSYVSVPKKRANHIIEALVNSKIKGAKVNAEIATTTR